GGGDDGRHHERVRIHPQQGYRLQGPGEVVGVQPGGEQLRWEVGQFARFHDRPGEHVVHRKQHRDQEQGQERVQGDPARPAAGTVSGRVPDLVLGGGGGRGRGGGGHVECTFRSLPPNGITVHASTTSNRLGACALARPTSLVP